MFSWFVSLRSSIIINIPHITHPCLSLVLMIPLNVTVTIDHLNVTTIINKKNSSWQQFFLHKNTTQEDKDHFFHPYRSHNSYMVNRILERIENYGTERRAPQRKPHDRNIRNVSNIFGLSSWRKEWYLELRKRTEFDRKVKRREAHK